MHARIMTFVVAVAAVVTLSCAKDPAVKKQESLAAGKRYFAQKKYGEAIIEFRKALQIDPKSGEARFELAEAYDRKGDAKLAFGEYVRVADLLPGNVVVQLWAGAFLIAAGKFEDAKARA